MRRYGAVALAAALAALAAGTAQAAPTPQDRADARLDVYTGALDRAGLAELAELGLDRHEVKLRAQRGKGTVRVEAILSGRQADQLRGKGVDMRAKRIDGMTAAERATALAADGLEVFRHYAGAGGLQEEFQQMAAANPRIAKLVTIGQTHQGQDIVALKVTKNANQLPDGKRPSVLYLGAQHAREWITPEMVRRLAHYYLDGYAGGDAQIRGIVDTTELWFLPVANPDGYDWTFEEDQRLWRKNLRDNNEDGVIDPDDGVDLNRNFAYKWGYDNEGSEPFPFSDTYRGPGPNSEPETQALDALMARVGFTFLVNYHSAAELLLYGVGWQVATPTPDDVIYEAMAGDDANPAVPGYDPDISAELYTTNGDTDSHAQALYGTLGFTPEMATCASASEENPDDAVGARGLRQRLRVPRRRGARPGRVRAQHPVRALRRALVARPGRPGVGRGSRGGGLPPRHVRRLLRRSADGGRVGQARAQERAHALPRRRRAGADDDGLRVDRRRALRRREQRLLRRVPRRRLRRRGG